MRRAVADTLETLALAAVMVATLVALAWALRR